MKEAKLIKHLKGAPGLRFFGFGPNLVPCRGLYKLQSFLNKNTIWAKKRKLKDLKKCLAKSDVTISIWFKNEIIGFGRGLSDGIYRGVLWDIVIDKNYQGRGYGKLIVNALLEANEMKYVEKIYLMTSNKRDFYCQMNFKEVLNQNLLIKETEVNF